MYQPDLTSAWQVNPLASGVSTGASSGVKPSASLAASDQPVVRLSVHLLLHSFQCLSRITTGAAGIMHTLALQRTAASLLRLIAFALQAGTKSSTPGRDSRFACISPKAAWGSARNTLDTAAGYSCITFIMRRNHCASTSVHAKATELPACGEATVFADEHALSAHMKELHVYI